MLPEDFFPRLGRLTQEDGRNALARKGHVLAPWIRTELLTRPQPGDDLYVQKDFVDMIMGLGFDSPRQPPASSAGKLGGFLRLEGGLEPFIASSRSRYAGRSLFDSRIPLDYLDWLARDFGNEGVRDLARDVARLRRLHGRDLQAALAEFKVQRSV